MKIIANLLVIVSFWVGFCLSAEKDTDKVRVLDRLDQMWVQTDDRLTIETAILRFGLDNSVTVFSKDVIELTWWSEDFKKAFSIVFYKEKAISRRLSRITNDPPLKQPPANANNEVRGK